MVIKEGSYQGESSSANNFGSGNVDMIRRRSGSVRDLPTKRNLKREFNIPTDSCTSGGGNGDQGKFLAPINSSMCRLSHEARTLGMHQNIKGNKTCAMN